jgi:hypothetical protein
MQDLMPGVDVSRVLIIQAGMFTCLVCFSNAVSFSIAACTFDYEGLMLADDQLLIIVLRHTLASFSASGSCLSTSLEKSLSGLRICPSDMMALGLRFGD